MDQKEEDKRSKDKELILRVLALHDEGYFTPMKRFLNQYLTDKKNLNSEAIHLKKQLFLKALEKASCLGEKPFHFIAGRLNYSLLDSVLVALITSSLNNEDVLSAFEKLKENKEYIDSVKYDTSSRKTTIERLRIAKKAFSSCE